jgi:energy-coupling factor transporter ATP-binding protein EcfA2
MTIYCSESDLLNESDVEQKFVYPLLTSAPPLGLGYHSSDFRTKPDLRQITIDKGGSAKVYYPDYIIILRGLPLVVIEAKRPGANLDDAFREARLYATEVNARFPNAINPCQQIIVSNGNYTFGGFWDAAPTIKLPFNNVYAENPDFCDFLKFSSKESLSAFCEKILQSIRGNSIFVKPRRLLGGRIVQDEELQQNSFGTSFALEYKHIFNPGNPEQRIDIVKNAYVASKRRMRHVEPIDRIIRAACPPSVTHAQQIEDTSNPKEIVSKLSDKSLKKHELLLLVGAVGSGKSTFTDFLRELGIPNNLKEKLIWISLDLNLAPLSREHIYSWLIEQIIMGLKNCHLEVDFDDLSAIKRVYSVELRKFEKGAGALFEKDSDTYKDHYARTILELQGNADVTTKSLIRFLCAERGKSLIVILDNCDKRTRDDQLLMFDVAKWLQKEYECLVFLPIRDTTFDHHRKEPPLDTVIKDLVFRIDPPSLMEVIYKRFNYALSQIAETEDETLYYYLPNGMRVEYPRKELAIYVSCILKSLFQSDAFFRRIILGVAGRDVRKGLEIFLDFCKSGHIINPAI